MSQMILSQSMSKVKETFPLKSVSVVIGSKRKVAPMDITVVLVRHDKLKTSKVSLSEGATVKEALKASGFSLAAADRVAVWNVLVDADTLLKEGDRVEILPELTVDPKEARRLREEKNRKSDSPLMGGRNGSQHRLF